MVVKVVVSRFALVVVAATCMLACGADVQGPELPAVDADGPAYDPEPVAPAEERPTGPTSEMAGSAAPTPVTPVEPVPAVGGTSGAASPAPVEPAPVAGSPAPEMPANTAGSSGSTPVEPVAGPGGTTPEPVAQPEAFCKLTTGRLRGQTLGCTDSYTRTAFSFVDLSWSVPSTEAASGYATSGCGSYKTDPCKTGSKCFAYDLHTDEEYEGVCL